MGRVRRVEGGTRAREPRARGGTTRPARARRRSRRHAHRDAPGRVPGRGHLRPSRTLGQRAGAARAGPWRPTERALRGTRRARAGIEDRMTDTATTPSPEFTFTVDAAHEAHEPPE